jgi:predicted nucleotide-binding protein
MSDRFYNSGNISNNGSGTLNQGGTHTYHYGAEQNSGEERRRQEVRTDELLAEPSRNVFVVHGRDEQVRQQVFGLLRRLDLRPLEWEALVRATGEASPFLGRVVADAPSLARAAVVLLTPDDVVMLHPRLRSAREERHELQPTLQPRPNVLLELGMVLAVYPQNTVILEFGELRPVADLAGRNVIRFNEAVSVTGALKKIAGRLEEAGCSVDDSGSDWLDVHPFADMNAYSRRPA